MVLLRDVLRSSSFMNSNVCRSLQLARSLKQQALNRHMCKITVAASVIIIGWKCSSVVASLAFFV